MVRNSVKYVFFGLLLAGVAAGAWQFKVGGGFGKDAHFISDDFGYKLLKDPRYIEAELRSAFVIKDMDEVLRKAELYRESMDALGQADKDLWQAVVDKKDIPKLHLVEDLAGPDLTRKREIALRDVYVKGWPSNGWIDASDEVLDANVRASVAYLDAINASFRESLVPAEGMSISPNPKDFTITGIEPGTEAILVLIRNRLEDKKVLSMAEDTVNSEGLATYRMRFIALRRLSKEEAESGTITIKPTLEEIDGYGPFLDSYESDDDLLEHFAIHLTEAT